MLLRRLKDQKAQAVAGEYLLTIFLVVGLVSGMTIYFRRALQARMRDARYQMLNIVQVRAAGAADNFIGNLHRAYEPYYANTVSTIDRTSQTQSFLLGGGSTGYFEKQYDDYTRVDSLSVVAPPRNAN